MKTTLSNDSLQKAINYVASDSSISEVIFGGEIRLQTMINGSRLLLSS